MSSEISRSSSTAFWHGRPYRQRNTVVEVDGHEVALLLHGSVIARRVGSRLEIRGANHPSQTTKSRLRQLLNVGKATLFDKQGEWVVRTEEGESIPVSKGMKWTLIYPGHALEQLANLDTE